MWPPYWLIFNSWKCSLPLKPQRVWDKTNSNRLNLKQSLEVIHYIFIAACNIGTLAPSNATNKSLCRCWTPAFQLGSLMVHYTVTPHGALLLSSTSCLFLFGPWYEYQIPRANYKFHKNTKKPIETYEMWYAQISAISASLTCKRCLYVCSTWSKNPPVNQWG